MIHVNFELLDNRNFVLLDEQNFDLLALLHGGTSKPSIQKKQFQDDRDLVEILSVLCMAGILEN